MIRFLFFAVSCLLYHGVCGVNVVSEDCVASVEQDTVIENQIITDSIPESFLEKLDYYYTSWYTGKRDSTYYVDSLCIAESCKNIIPCNDSVYLLRLDSLQSAVQRYCPYVHRTVYGEKTVAGSQYVRTE
mgnify:CR=1 FL=1